MFTSSGTSPAKIVRRDEGANGWSRVIGGAPSRKYVMCAVFADACGFTSSRKVDNAIDKTTSDSTKRRFQALRTASVIKAPMRFPY